MLYRLWLLPLLLLVQIAIAQSNHVPIRVPDSLNNEDQVLAFVQNLKAVYGLLSFHPNRPIYGLRDHEKKAQDFGALSYEKADLDNNGYIDLLFNGYETQSDYSFPLSLVTLFFDRDSLRVIRLPDETFFDFFTAKTVYINGQAFLHILQISRKSREEWRPGSHRAIHIDYTEHRSDTLLWFQNNFIERIRPVKHSVTKIRYVIGGGMTLIGAVRLTIRGDSVKLEKEADASPEKPMDYGGVFITRLDSGTSHRLYTLLEYLDFPHLKNNYQVRGTDAPTGTLEITYDRGKKKTISDYGAMGTYGLSALQSLLLELPNTQQWTRTDAETPRMLIDLDH